MTRRYESWGRFPRKSQRARRLTRRDALLPCLSGSMLPFGNGRSYGDVCLNSEGTLLDARGLDRFMAFDRTNGLLRCEAGVLLDDIITLVLPSGWFLPVTPGTRFVTLGGAIANDVHGKNHHLAGSFCEHVERFELLRSDGRHLCSRTENVELFAATAGGLGLTGLITWAELRLRRVEGPFLQVENHRFPSLDGFFELSAASDSDFEYTVAWIDCMAKGPGLGRGIFMRGNHAGPLARGPLPSHSAMTVPLTPPVSLVGGAPMRWFNALYYHLPRPARVTTHFQPYFYPLDAIGHWNRLYGPGGLLQLQCVVPPQDGRGVIHGLLTAISDHGDASFLAVLKQFGRRPSPGLLSFPRPGVTLALDFPNRGTATFALLDRLEAIVREAGGAIYPAKDARMSPELFRSGFPSWERLEQLRDRAFGSDLWRRLTADRAVASG